ncbi:hypothetical protein [Thermoleptolyngbya sp. PKUAC-SCTB121]|uniref:hypothetical protein n=1 Tax=Thermoleptolyngbya sp. PKUAC-SCTB121 TaxID=2811482 RepID=UPI0019637A9D|nr:hypothetical protein [Thermoleptolyngbya sp. PKUAC-SCTB121]
MGVYRASVGVFLGVFLRTPSSTIEETDEETDDLNHAVSIWLSTDRKSAIAQSRCFQMRAIALLPNPQSKIPNPKSPLLPLFKTSV